ncbi:MAG: hypothetical protein KatS3mg053_0155 [Candidatus Roseilinea sp.]|nr:MAG: hypothetical protein KatS3mg053_0155 [Candidatus Roseilinea sp.]
MSLPAALDDFRRALIAYGERDFDRARRLAQQAAQSDPANIVYSAAVTYLDCVMREGQSQVYVAPEAFGAFIRGGGNIPLYARTSAVLRRAYAEYASLALLDIGVGDGLALLPSLTPNISRLDVLDPSRAMLDRASAALNARGVAHRAIHMTVQQFLRTDAGRYDIAQATFAMQALPPGERPDVLAGLRAFADRLLIVEFDVPDFEAAREDLAAPARVRYFVERYRRGLAEYAGHGDLVAQGFLMPIFFGAFDPGEARLNWEMPIAGWVRAVREAGFDAVRIEPIYDYWWATAYLISAT